MKMNTSPIIFFADKIRIEREREREREEHVLQQNVKKKYDIFYEKVVSLSIIKVVKAKNIEIRKSL